VTVTLMACLQGFANLIADGVSMGFGEYMSMSAEMNHIRLERGREAWEMDNYPQVGQRWRGGGCLHSGG
jgi:vacuolar iron transporter family protein